MPFTDCLFLKKVEVSSFQSCKADFLVILKYSTGFYIDTFRIPTACTCHVKAEEFKYYSTPSYSIQGSLASMNINRDKTKSNLGDTLWSLLGTEPDKGQLNDKGNSQVLNNFFSEQLKGGESLNQGELMKLLPHLTSIAPENVLQQLLEDSYGDTSSQSYGNRLTNKFRMNYVPNRVSGEGKWQKMLTRVHRNELIKPNMNINSRLSAEKVMSFSRPSTSIVNAESNQAAPVVQVIHVPVSSDIVTADVESSQSPLDDNNSFIPRNRFRSVLTTSVSNRNRNIPKHHMISTNSHYLHSQSKTNSSVAILPKSTTVSFEINKSQLRKMDNTMSENGRDKPVKQILNKKINFSYHPILEYIVQ